MKPYHILIVAPYESFRSLFFKALQDRTDIEADIYSASLHETRDLVSTLDTTKYEVAICRGRSGFALQQYISIPVVNVDFSPFDVLRGLHLASLGNYKKMAFVSFFEMHDTIQLLSELLHFPANLLIPPAPASSEEMETLIKDLHEQHGIDFFIGDGACVHCAKALGVDSLLITSGQECLEDALDRAIDICRIQRKYSSENDFYKTLLLEGESQCAIFDEHKQLIASNIPQTSSELLGSMRSHIQRILRLHRAKWLCTGETEAWAIHGECIHRDDRPYVLCTISKSLFPVSKTVHYFKTLERPETEADLLLIANNPGLTPLWEQAKKIAPLRTPMLISGDYCTGKITFAHALFALSANSNNRLLEIDFRNLDAKGISKILNSPDSPIFENECSILFTNLESLCIPAQLELATIIKTLNLHHRSKIFTTINGNPDQLILESHLLQELSYLLNGYSIHLPSLNDSPDQITSIARSYLNELNQEFPLQLGGFEPSALKLLQDFHWEYGINQFKMALKQMALETDGLLISEKQVRLFLAKSSAHKLPATPAASTVEIKGSLDDIIYEVIMKVLKEEGMNQSKAAERLKISRGTIWKKIRRPSNN